MSEYYFLPSLLPELQLGHRPALGYDELSELLQSNLSKSDLERTRRLRALIDLENLRSYWSGETHDRRGNYTRDELIEALESRALPGGRELPDYLLDYLSRYPTDKERLDHFFFLISEFLKLQMEDAEGFLCRYFTFEKEMRLVLVGFRAKQQGRDLVKELQYEDASDPLVAQILAQKDAKVYEPPFEYKELKPIFEEFSTTPLELHKALAEYRLNHIQDLYSGEIFTMDRILGFMARLLIVERWLEIDVKRGVEIIDEVGRIEA